MAEGEGVFTNIDAFVKFLNEHGETESTVLAATLGVSERNIEEWAKILERSKMAKITYKLGKMFVAPINAPEKSTTEAKQIAEVKKEILGSEIVGQLGEVNRLSQKVDEFNKFVANSENVMRTNSVTIRDTLSKINKLQSEVNVSFNNIKEKKVEVEKFSEELRGMLANLSNSANMKSVASTGNANAKAVVEDLRTKIRVFEESNDQMLASYDKSVKQQRAKIIDFNKSIKKEIDSLKGILSDEERSLQVYEKNLKSYTDESDRMKKRLEKNKTSMLDSMEKTKNDIDTLYSTADRETKKINEILANASKGLEGFNDLMKRMADIKNGAALINREISELRIQLELLQEQLKTAESMGKEKSDQKKAIIEGVDRATQETSKKIGNATSRIERLKKKIDDFSK